MKSSLYTQQSIANRANSGFGKMRLIVPPGSALMSGLLTCIVLSAIYLLTAQPYLRKTTVQGYLHADVMRLAAERPGTLARLLVTEGQIVSAQVPIAIIQSRVVQQSEDHLAYELLLQAAEQRLGDTQQTQRQEADQLLSTQDRLEQSLLRLINIRKIQTTRVDRLESVFIRASALMQQGHLSTLEWGEFQDQMLSAQQQLEEINDKFEQRERDLRQVRLDNEQISTKHSLVLLELREEKIRLSQARDNWLATASQVIRAPADGKIASIFKRPGDIVNMKESILTLVPKSEVMHARLLIPSHAIGFIRPGQNINILYDAFPHLQFGTYRGTLQSVSTHAIHAQDLPLEIPLQGTYYLAVVTLATTVVTAYGVDTELRPGMTLKADVVLDKRTLFDWLLEPLLIARGHYV